MNVLEEMRKILHTPTEKPKTPVEKKLEDKDVITAIKTLHSEGIGYKKITSTLNELYKGKLGVTIKESRTNREDSYGTRATSEGNTRYLYKVDNKFTEPQICDVLGIIHPLSKGAKEIIDQLAVEDAEKNQISDGKPVK